MGMRENARKGKEGEAIVKEKLEFAGYEVKRTPKEKDFYAVKRNFSGKVVDGKHVEVKTGKVGLSKAQKVDKKRLGKRYKVMCEHPFLY